MARAQSWLRRLTRQASRRRQAPTSIVTLSSSNNNVVSLPSNRLSRVTQRVSALLGHLRRRGFAGHSHNKTGSASGFNSGKSGGPSQGPGGLTPLRAPSFRPARPPWATSTSGRLVVSLTDPAGQSGRSAGSRFGHDFLLQHERHSFRTDNDDPGRVPRHRKPHPRAQYPGHGEPHRLLAPAWKSDFGLVTVAEPSQPVNLRAHRWPPAEPGLFLADESAEPPDSRRRSRDGSGNPGRCPI